MVNKTKFEISEILINTSNEIIWNVITSSKLILEKRILSLGNIYLKQNKNVAK